MSDYCGYDDFGLIIRDYPRISAVGRKLSRVRAVGEKRGKTADCADYTDRQNAGTLGDFHHKPREILEMLPRTSVAPLMVAATSGVSYWRDHPRLGVSTAGMVPWERLFDRVAGDGGRMLVCLVVIR